MNGSHRLKYLNVCFSVDILSERIKKCSLKVGVTLLEEVCHWVRALKF